MPKRTAHFPPDFDFSKLPHIEVITGIRFSDEVSELQDESAIAQPSPFISADGSIVLVGDVSPLLQLIKIVPKIIENIANKLDPQSFLNLASSCTQLYNFFSRPTARNHIDIPLKKEKLTLEREGRNRRLILTYMSELVPIPMAVGGLDFRKCVRMIRKWPFSVHVDRLSFEEDCETAIPQVREVLQRLGAVSIQMLQSVSGLTYAELTGFINRYRVKELDLRETTYIYTENELTALAQKPLDALFIDGFPLKLLPLTSIPTICIEDDRRGDMNMTILQSIVKKWLVADNLVRWEIGSSMSVVEVMASFSNYFSLLSPDFKGPMPVLRPLIFRTGQRGDEDDGMVLLILREDGLLLKVTDCRQMQEITLTFWPIVDGRPALYPL